MSVSSPAARGIDPNWLEQRAETTKCFLGEEGEVVSGDEALSGSSRGEVAPPVVKRERRDLGSCATIGDKAPSVLEFFQRDKVQTEQACSPVSVLQGSFGNFTQPSEVHGRSVLGMESPSEQRGMDSGSEDSRDDDLESVRSSFDFFESQRPSFDFTSDFKGQFRPPPTVVLDSSQNLEGFRETGSDTLSSPRASGLDTPSSSSQEFMQIIGDQVEGKMQGKNPPKALLNLIGTETDDEDETDLILLDHDTADQYIRASLRLQLLHLGSFLVASLIGAGFVLSLLFYKLRIKVEVIPSSQSSDEEVRSWWIFGSGAVQGLVVILAVLVTALLGVYVSDSRRALQKAQVRAESKEQYDLIASRRSERRAMQRAKTATRAKQQFMAYVFHNIRVPFNAIVLGLGHMRAAEYGDSLPGDKMDLVQMMLDCAETMTSVLDDVTDMSQWEDNKLELRTDDFDLLAVVRFLSWGLRDLLDQKNINFGMVIDPRARAVLSNHKTVGDKHRVVQVLGQFLSNAVKLTPRNGNINLVMACEDLEWIEEEQLGQIGWRIAKTERRSDSNRFKTGPLSDEALHSNTSLSRTITDPSSAEEAFPKKRRIPSWGPKSEVNTDSKRRPRRSFERSPSTRDPFAEIPSVQRVDSDEQESEGVASDPGSEPKTPPSEKAAPSIARSPRLEANKPSKLTLPNEAPPGPPPNMMSPAGPLEICRLPSIPSSSGSGVMKHDSLPSTWALTPTPLPSGELPSIQTGRRSLDSAQLSPNLTAHIVAALSSGLGARGFDMADRMEGLKLSKEAMARIMDDQKDPTQGLLQQLSLDAQAGMKAAGGQVALSGKQLSGEGLEGRTKEELTKEIRKQKRKGLNETILELKGGELVGDRGRRPTPRKKRERRLSGEGRQPSREDPFAERLVESGVPEKMVPSTGSNESLSPSNSTRKSSPKNLANLPIVGFATIRISVKDTGSAISEEEQEKLFEPYSRIATGCMQRAGVSTLGLSLAKRFVRQVGGSIGADSQNSAASSTSPSSSSVGGSIGVDSQQPNGNSFWFSIPFPLVAEDETANESTSIASSDAERATEPQPSPRKAKEENTSDAQDEANRAFTGKLARKLSGGKQGQSTAVGRALHHAISKSLGGSLRGDVKQMSELRRQLSVEKEGDVKEKSQAEKDANEGKRKVLLVEDTEINRIIMRKVLQNLGLLCDEAENGQVAVDLLKQGRHYDLILMDKEMPVMDGHEATRLLRKMGVKTPIIALTGNALKSDRELFFEAGVDEFQTKPLSRDKLVQLLVRLGWKQEHIGKGGGVNVLSPRMQGLDNKAVSKV